MDGVGFPPLLRRLGVGLAGVVAPVVLSVLMPIELSRPCDRAVARGVQPVAVSATASAVTVVHHWNGLPVGMAQDRSVRGLSPCSGDDLDRLGPGSLVAVHPGERDL